MALNRRLSLAGLGAAAALGCCAISSGGLQAAEAPALTATSSCVSCHGVRGEGRTAMNGPRIGGMDAAYIERQLNAYRLGHRGGGEVAGGEAMAAMARGMSTETIVEVAQAVAAMTPPALPLTEVDDGADDGEAAYKSCVACHGEAAQGMPELGSPALVYQDPMYLSRALKAYRDGARGTHAEDTYGLQMAALAKGLDDESIDAVVAHIGSLRPPREEAPAPETTASVEEGLAAFADIYSVASSPRCVNCHPDGDTPLQTDESLPHTMDITRFSPLAGEHCSTCHAASPVGDGLAPLPPADPVWSMPPREMALHNKSAQEVCAQLTDLERNGYRTPEELADHVANDHLLITSWGSGRTPPPLSHEAFTERFRLWAAAGAPCPE